MDKRQQNFSKNSRLTSASLSYNPTAIRETFRSSNQSTILREYQILVSQARQLQVQNRQLISDVDKLKYQKTMHENKLIKKEKSEEQTLSQYHKEKNYQIQMLKIKNQEEITRFRRQFQVKLDDIQRQIRSRDNQNKQIMQKSHLLQSKSAQFRGKLQNLEQELVKLRVNTSSLSQQLTREEFANKKLEMLAQEIQSQKTDMEIEIHILLDIQAQKGNTISILQNRLITSQNSQKQLEQKLSQLTSNFHNLETHINEMKQQQATADIRRQELDREIEKVQYQISVRQQMMEQQKYRLIQLREQIGEHKQRESKRLGEIQDLMSDNQRIYHELVFIRHQLYEVSIEQGIDI